MAHHYQGHLGNRQLGVGAVDVQDPKVENGETVAGRFVMSSWLAPEQTIVTSSCAAQLSDPKDRARQAQGHDRSKADPCRIGLRASEQKLAEPLPRQRPSSRQKRSTADDAALRFLQETEELLALAQEACGIGIFEWQVSTGVVRLSPRFLSLYGLTEFDGRYESWLKCIFRRDDPRITDLFDTAFAAQEREVHSEFRIIMPPDGKLRWMEARNNLFYDGAGVLMRVVGVNVQIT